MLALSFSCHREHIFRSSLKQAYEKGVQIMNLMAETEENKNKWDKHTNPILPLFSCMCKQCTTFSALKCFYSIETLHVNEETRRSGSFLNGDSVNEEALHWSFLVSMWDRNERGARPASQLIILGLDDLWTQWDLLQSACITLLTILKLFCMTICTCVFV